MILFFSILIFLWILSPFIKRWPSVLLIFLGFAILIGFRGIDVGVDTKLFQRIYITLSNGKYVGYPEPLYAYMNIWANQLGLSYNVFLFILGLIFSTCMSVGICLSSPKPGFSVFSIYGLYMIFYAMNISRQMIAVAIVFLAYTLLSRHKKLWFILLVLIASQIHSSAIIALVALILTSLDLSNKRFIIVSVSISILLGILLSDSLIMSLADKLGGDYALYLHQTNNRNGFRTDERVLLGILLALYWTSLFLFVLRYIKRPWRNSLWMKLYFVAILCINLTMRMELGLRIVLYFSVAEAIAFAIFIGNNRLRFKPTGSFVISLYLIIFFTVFLLGNSAGILPYTNILFK